MNILKFQTALADFAKERDWDQFHSPKNLAMAISGEAGELIELFQWLPEHMEFTEDPELHQRAKEEVADIILYCLRFAEKMDIDLEEALTQKMQQNGEKYPVAKSKGSAKKYTHL